MVAVGVATRHVATTAHESKNENSHMSRFDRQLRLWGCGGQDKLEATYVLALGCDAIIAEVLDSLCASGLSDFCLVNSKTADEEIHGNMFAFYTREKETDLMGHILLQHLKQLAPNVQGKFVPMEECAFVDRLISGMSTLPISSEESLIVLANNETQHLVEKLRQYCSSKWHTECISILSHGPYVFVKPHISPTIIINSHKPKFEIDLLLNAPPPSLISLAESTFASMHLQYSRDDPRLKSIPFVLILTHLRERFIREEGRPPTNSKNDISIFTNWMEELKSACLLEDDCLEEARDNLFRVVKPYEIPDGITALTNAVNLLPAQSIAVKAISRFVEKTGRHPMSAKIPDMFSETKSYLELKEVYRKQASEDWTLLIEEVSDPQAFAILNDISSSWAQVDLFDAETATLTNFAEVLQDSIAMEPSNFEGYAQDGSLANDFTYAQNDCPSIASAAIALLAYAHKGNRALEEAHGQIVHALTKICPELESTLKDPRHLHHLRQCETVDCLPAVSGIVGGMISSEIIKMTTQQFVPLNRMLIFDGVTSRCITIPLIQDHQQS